MALLTEKVCKAYIANKSHLPNFPEKIWTKEFIDYCMEHAESTSGFEQMPEKLQTVEIIENVVGKSIDMVRYARKELISLPLAEKIHRNELQASYPSLKNYIPECFYNDFMNLTGLPADFMGGEVSFYELKKGKQNYTYCKMDEAYLGFYVTHSRATYLIMTCRTPQFVKPKVIFDKCIGAYHLTWLEKMVAENYLNFTKPKVPSSLKGLQANCYYDVVLHAKENNCEIYRNTFLGGTVNFVARHEGNAIAAPTLNEIKEKLQLF